MTRKTDINWDAVEVEYRLGQKPLRAIAAEYGTTHQSILRRAKKFDWQQDKTAEVRRRTANALLVDHANRTKKDVVPTREDLDKAVRSNIEVVLAHRKDIKKARDLVNLLASQLGTSAEHRDVLEDDIYKETGAKGPKEKPDLKRRNFMLKAVSLPSHAGALRDLATALKHLIPLERDAFNMDDKNYEAQIMALEKILAHFPTEYTREVRDILASELFPQGPEAAGRTPKDKFH